MCTLPFVHYSCGYRTKILDVTTRPRDLNKGHVLGVDRTHDGVLDLRVHDLERVAAQHHVHVLVALQLENMYDLHIAFIGQQTVNERLTDDEMINGAVRDRQRRERRREPRPTQARIEYAATRHEAVQSSRAAHST